MTIVFHKAIPQLTMKKKNEKILVHNSNPSPDDSAVLWMPLAHKAD